MKFLDSDITFEICSLRRIGIFEALNVLPDFHCCETVEIEDSKVQIFKGAY